MNKHVAWVPPWIWLSSGVNAALSAVGPGAADTVIAAVSYADPFVRQWAVAALEGLRYPAAASALVHSVREDPDPAVRRRALRTLASTYAEHPDALATLEFVASHDSVRSVQKTATKLLKKAHRSK
jgi:HEAT repeat protein